MSLAVVPPCPACPALPCPALLCPALPCLSISVKRGPLYPIPILRCTKLRRGCMDTVYGWAPVSNSILGPEARTGAKAAKKSPPPLTDMGVHGLCLPGRKV